MLETFFYLIMNILFFPYLPGISSLTPTETRKQLPTLQSLSHLLHCCSLSLYHVYTFTSAFSKIKKTGLKFGQILDRLLSESDPKPKPGRRETLPPDDDIHRFNNELLDMIDRPVNTIDY
jgi:hypothetical protein